MVLIRIVQLQLRTIQGMRNKMNKVFYLILISLFSLTIISCAKKDDSSSISNSTDNSSVTLNISSFVIDTTLAAGTITGGVLSQDNDSDLSGVSVGF